MAGRPSRTVRSIILTSVLGPTQAVGRTIGALSDGKTQAVVAQCGGAKPDAFVAGNCPNLINCLYENLEAATTAGFQSGGNIAALVPTILALIGCPPLELVQIGLISPHRAAAACLFSIGLPSGLFRQLRGKSLELADRNYDEPRERIWSIPVATDTSDFKKLAGRTTADVAIIGFAGIMLWRNWVVGSQTMVTWRCEYSWLIFCWPFACLIWLVLSLALLFLFKKTIKITYTEDEEHEERSFKELLLLPYRTPKTRPQHHNGEPKKIAPRSRPNADKSPSIMTTGSDTADKARKNGALLRQSSGYSNAAHGVIEAAARAGNIQPQSPAFLVLITMPTDYGLFSWRWYEAIIETLAVGIYLYATFVLTSLLFLSGQEGIIYAVVMVLSLSAARIVEAVY